MRPLLEFAPAKINLTLRVLGRRADGFHALESFVAFARVRDALTFLGDTPEALAVRGPTAEKAGTGADNLVLKAANALTAQVSGLQRGSFTLIKRLPVAAGIGGGSSDAAAALRLLARHNGLTLDDPRVMAAAAATGSDVPVCLSPGARVMRGRGEELSRPLTMPALPAVLVNCGLAVATRDVFAGWAKRGSASTSDSASDFAVGARPRELQPDAVIEAIAGSGNDLEAPAIALCPTIADVLAALRALPGCRLARMSGSGATCFALFSTMEAAGAARRVLKTRHPAWWIQATTLG